ncbi:Delta-60 repeat protein [Pseudomonas sp. IT-P44]|uniref:hypothetical protein n=1 Tax=Pseudomonas sp. IT-P44 TaxID=3026451 RepID=UPI0039E1F59B
MVTHNDTPGVAASGELDPSFATGGKFQAPAGTGKVVSLLEEGESMTLAMTAPTPTRGDFFLCRVSKNGVLDQTFGTGGVLKWRFEDAGSSILGEALLQPDRKILLIGNSDQGGKSRLALTRVNSSGSPDLVFGRKIHSLYPDSHTLLNGFHGCLQPDGKIIVTCHYSVGGKYISVLVRLLADGELDLTFGVAGKAEIPSSAAFMFSRRVLVQNSGRIIVVGYMTGQSFVAGFTAGGTLDITFADQGFWFFAAQGTEFAFIDLLVLRDDRIRCVGGSAQNAGIGALLVGLDKNGKLEQGFNGGQPVITQRLLGRWHSISEQDDGKLLVIGESGGAELVCSRFLPSGAIDTDFGWSGFMYHPGHPVDCVVQSSGRWVTAVHDSGGRSSWLYGLTT